mmetsp:Transcript_36122/g.81609  ORF Transcript_36122/g.81609 Transcript_36122/m.81609 type:complete len:143 (-) Transcript_36122:60-488(-)
MALAAMKTKDMKAAKPMKATRATKATKAMKGRRVKRKEREIWTETAKGRMAKVLVYRGTRAKTPGGLTAEKLTKNKDGRVVSFRKAAHGERVFARWREAVQDARKAMNAKGFVALNGKSILGKAIYLKARAIYYGEQAGPSA